MFSCWTDIDEALDELVKSLSWCLLLTTSCLQSCLCQTCHAYSVLQYSIILVALHIFDSTFVSYLFIDAEKLVVMLTLC